MTTKTASPQSLLNGLEDGNLEWSNLTESQKDAVHELCMQLERQRDGLGGGNNQPV